MTSHDVAVASGVSQATVARVFSSPHLVAPDTQALVLASAERLGYVPNAIARSLKSQRTGLVSAVVPVQGEYWQGVVTALARRLADHDRHLLLFSFDHAAAVERVLTTVDQYRVDGLVLASSTIEQEHLLRMKRPGPPTVVFGQPAAAGVLPLVTVDNQGGARVLAAHVAEREPDRVLYIGGVASASTDRQRYRGAAEVLGSHGIGCAYLEAGAFTYEAGYRVGDSVLAGGNLPDVVMVGSDEVAFGLLDRLRSASVDVPGDVMLTGFDGLPQAAWAGYDLTTLVQPVEVLVDAVIDLLLEGSADEQPPTVIIPGELRIGTTTGGQRG